MVQGPKGQKIRRMSEKDRQRAWDLYFTSKESSETIAKRLGFSGPAIRMFLKRQGGVLRDAVIAHRTKLLNEHAFDILTPESSYWLGVLMTDGCVYDEANPQSSPRIELQWECEDAEHIRAFDVFMGGGDRINVHTRPKGVYHRWDARSTHLAETLLRYGISPRKTKTACPAECLRMNSDFWRGCIDGDGEVDEGNNCPDITLTGSFALVREFCTFMASVCPEYPLQPRPTGHTDCTVDVKLHGQGGMAVLKTLYKDATVAMPRKMKKAQEMLTKFDGKTFRILRCDIHQKTTFPYVYTDLRKAEEDFKGLCKLDARTLVESQVKGSVTAITMSAIARSKVGAIASHTFHERVRMMARARGKVSPIDMWNDLSMREKIIAEAENRKHSSLRASMTANCQPCWGFLPATAKAVYQHFCNDTPDVRILDPCAGWGDRLTAALSLKNFGFYLGYDPNTNMNLVYERIINCYGGFGKASVCPQAFEVGASRIDPETYDIAFTSPPYFNYEEYSDDPEQSYKKYPDPLVWRENFLASIPRLCAQALKPRGVMAINISDAGKAPLVDWLMEEAGEVSELQFIGTLLMQTGNFDRSQEGIYCWRKTQR
jgi:hypothetical protein